VLGERLGGYIYGTIVVLATVVAGAEAYRNGAGHIVLLVLMTTFVFWLAHVYAHALAHSVSTGKRISGAELVRLAHRESSIIEAAVVPVAVLALGKLDVLSVHTAVWLAIACGLGVLVAQGFRYARAEHLGVLGTVAVAGGNLAMGLLIVGLKLVVGH
jgi:hypothetical protein